MYKKTITALLVTTALSGCINTEEPKSAGEIQKQVDRIESYLNGDNKDKKKSGLIISKSRFVDASPVMRESGVEWLKNQRVSIKKGYSGGVPLSAVIEQFNASGINISSSLPLHQYTYNGFNINNTDALTALEIISASTGLDFKMERHKQSAQWFVSMLPMGVSEYTLNIGHRDISVNVIGQGLDKSSLGDMTTQSGSESEGSQSDNGKQESSSVKYQISFFEELEKELEGRLVRQLPSIDGGIGGDLVGLVNPGEFPEQFGAEPGMTSEYPIMQRSPSASQAGGSGESSQYQKVSIGQFTINRATGRITVHAPRHIRREVMTYLKELDMELSANIELTGKIFVLNETNEDSQGIDFQSFIQFANKKWGLSVTNNVINGLNVMSTGDMFSAGSDDPLAGNLIGLRHGDKLLHAFNAYLESEGNAVTLLEPHVNTTSGVPASITQRRPLTFSRFTANSGNGDNSGPATSNELFTIDFGTSLQIMPKYDVRKDVIRAQIDLTQVIQGGTQEIQQVVTTLNEIETKTSQLPIPDIYSVQTEAIISNGSLVIMGGQKMMSEDNSFSGTTGLVKSAVGGLFGKGRQKSRNQRFYMVLSAKAIPYQPAELTKGNRL